MAFENLKVDVNQMRIDRLIDNQGRVNFLERAIRDESVFESLDTETKCKVRPFRDKFLGGKPLNLADYKLLQEIAERIPIQNNRLNKDSIEQGDRGI